MIAYNILIDCGEYETEMEFREGGVTLSEARELLKTKYSSYIDGFNVFLCVDLESIGLHLPAKDSENP